MNLGTGMRGKTKSLLDIKLDKSCVIVWQNVVLKVLKPLLCQAPDFPIDLLCIW